MMLISTRPTWGIFLPFISAMRRLSSGSLPGLKSQTKPRYPGFASRMIFDARTQSLSTKGPVPTGFDIARPDSSAYFSITSRATADVGSYANRNGRLKSVCFNRIRSV